MSEDAGKEVQPNAVLPANIDFNKLVQGMEKLDTLLKLAEERDGYKQDLFKTKEKMTQPLSEAEEARKEAEALRQKVKELEENSNITVNQYKTQYEELTKTTHIRDALNKADAYAELLEPHLKSRVKIVEHEGVQKVVVTDAAGNIVKNGDSFASINDLIEEYKNNPSYSVAFKSNKVTGTGITQGSSNAGNAGTSNNPWITGNRTEQNMMLKKDPALAEKLKIQSQKR